MNRFLMIASAAIVTLSACSSYADGHGGMVKTSADGYFTDGHDMTLYTFDKDSAGESKCNAGCARAWPPLMAKEGAALPEGFTAIARKNGDLQVAYKDQPLYLWVNDQKPGDVTGDGVQGVWHIAKP